MAARSRFDDGTEGLRRGNDDIRDRRAQVQLLRSVDSNRQGRLHLPTSVRCVTSLHIAPCPLHMKVSHGDRFGLSIGQSDLCMSSQSLDADTKDF